MVVISSTFSDHVKDYLSNTTVYPHENQFGDHARSNLSDKGWSTIVRLHFEKTRDDKRKSGIWASAGRESVALLVSASHQSSPDMDTKAHGSALARFASRWEAKARVMWMVQDSQSARKDPLKHLHVGQWPRLRGIICHGQPGIALPVCWL